MSDRDLPAAWSREIERRVRETDDGSVDLVDWEDIRAELFDDAPPEPPSS